MRPPTVIAAHWVAGHRVSLQFSDGFREALEHDPPAVFAVLKQGDEFARFRLQDGTLHWPGDLDLAPEYLYFRAFAHEPELQSRFADWGYLDPSLNHA